MKMKLLPPRLNGARVFGCRPGSPVHIGLTASGSGPLRYEVDPLPPGLRFDEKSGRFTGRFKQAGRHTLNVHLSGPGGKAKDQIVIHCGSRLAMTPPMGWNSWNGWAVSVSQEKMLAAARGMADLLRPHGWTFVNIDDAWQGERSKRAPYALQPNEKFPDMAELARQIHDLGLKFGLYSTPWATSYAGFRGGSDDRPDGRSPMPPHPTNWWKRRSDFRHGLHSFAAADARQWAAWGVDFLKYDWFPNDLASTVEMSAALKASGRDIIYSLSNTMTLQSVIDTLPHANLWRTTGDIVDKWSEDTADLNGFQGIRDIIRHHSPYHLFQKPGHWNDPDMLVLGQVGWGPKLHQTRLTRDEQVTHFATWCLWSAPLLIGCPMDTLDAFTLDLLTNDELIALNQDAYGVQGYPILRQEDHLILRKPLVEDRYAYGLLNLGERPREITLDWKLAELPDATHRVRDLVSRRDLGEFKTRVSVEVPPHGIRVLLCQPA